MSRWACRLATPMACTARSHQCQRTPSSACQSPFPARWASEYGCGFRETVIPSRFQGFFRDLRI